jgi:hypothetical protein
MSGRLDPPHERVVLTPTELQVLAGLEDAYESDGVASRRGLLARVASSLGRLWHGCAAWLIVIGTVVMVATVAASLVVSAAGALVAGLGLAGVLRRARRRR